MIIEDRIKEIDKFLKVTFNKVNEIGTLTSSMIYHDLIRYNFGFKYDRVDFSKEVFPSLIDKNNQRNKRYGINNYGYVDYENFSGNFCVFCNDDVLKDCDPIKLYLAWEPEYVNNYVDLIIDFMIKNNISYYLKVARIVRNDMVTIRVKKISDAYMVMDFINTYLQQGAMKPNPFCMTNGIIGLAIDNYNSYNSKVSELIFKYFEFKINSGNIDVNYDDFVLFVSQFNYSNNFNVDNEHIRNNPVFLNEVKDLIYKAITINNMGVFEQHYSNVSKNRSNNRVENEVKTSDLSFEILALFVDETIKRHGKDFAIYGLNEYFTYGSIQGLSRIKDSNGVKGRDLLNNIDRNYIVNNLMNKYANDDVYQISIMYVNERLSQKNDDKKENDELAVLSATAKDTYLKYGYEHTVIAIANFLNNGYMDSFTRRASNGKMSRDLLKQINYNDIKKTLIQIYITNNLEELARYFIDNYVIDDNRIISK